MLAGSGVQEEDSAVYVGMEIRLDNLYGLASFAKLVGLAPYYAANVRKGVHLDSLYGPANSADRACQSCAVARA